MRTPVTLASGLPQPAYLKPPLVKKKSLRLIWTQLARGTLEGGVLPEGS